MTHARLYRPSDEPELVRLAAAPMPGWVRLRYDYASGYAAAEALKGDSEIVVVEDGDGHIAGCGTRSTRCLYLDGEPSKVGYLSGLRSFAAGRRGWGLFRGFQMIANLEAASPNVLTFTTILDDNPEGRSLLTSGRVGLPKYSPCGKVVTYALSGRRGTMPERVSFDDLAAFYARESPRRQLFPVFGSKLPPGLSLDDFFVIRRGGRIVAAAAVWNHGARRRILVDGYGNFVLRALRPALNAFSRWPRLPAPGGEFACSYLAYALAENDDPFLFSGLVELARRTCCGRNIVLSLHASDPLCNVVKSLGGFNYGSEFLTVKFDGCSHELCGVPYIEAGAL